MITTFKCGHIFEQNYSKVVGNSTSIFSTKTLSNSIFSFFDYYLKLRHANSSYFRQRIVVSLHITPPLLTPLSPQETSQLSSLFSNFSFSCFIEELNSSDVSVIAYHWYLVHSFRTHNYRSLALLKVYSKNSNKMTIGSYRTLECQLKLNKMFSTYHCIGRFTKNSKTNHQIRLENWSRMISTNTLLQM